MSQCAPARGTRLPSSATTRVPTRRSKRTKRKTSKNRNSSSLSSKHLSSSIMKHKNSPTNSNSLSPKNPTILPSARPLSLEMSQRIIRFSIQLTSTRFFQITWAISTRTKIIIFPLSYLYPKPLQSKIFSKMEKKSTKIY